MVTVIFPAKSIANAKQPPIDQPSKTRSPADSLLFYHQTVSEGRFPNKRTLTSAIKACTFVLAVIEGKAIHAQIIKNESNADRFLASALVSFYSACGELNSARQVFDEISEKDTTLRTTMMVAYVQNGAADMARCLFDEMPDRDVASWNAMLSGYAQNGMPRDAIQLFRAMQISNCRPNDITLVSTLSACSQLGCLSLGAWIHAYIIRSGYISFTSTLTNSLIHMYAKCGRLDIAYDVFAENGPRNLETWNTMLTSFAIHGCGVCALSLFCQMMKMGLMPDRITFLAILMACSHCGMIDHAYKCFDCMCRVYGVEPQAEYYGCLVDVLARSGLLVEAMMVVEEMPFEPDISVWGAVLGGCLTHGNYKLGIRAANHLLEQEPYEEARYIALSNLYAMAGKLEEAVKVRKVMRDAGIKKISGSSSIEVDGCIHDFLSGDRSHCRSMEIYSMVEIIDRSLELENSRSLLNTEDYKISSR
ncbi:pentatricopeptide repeat-containing protein At2g29760, chloroplastic-like [Macadamia integrifolia]|uniref:pentatricopeptide repeat-containing protein At2g29760, chloroplastic-like n=1 Tax=Macadamia integrifolia TaxID=60698 RepID=UPI001C4F374A|nr:pentatricopeptide repeat-containing protein At2g29760, chloroplastic-like [Macadamia integrifolia]